MAQNKDDGDVKRVKIRSDEKVVTLSREAYEQLEMLSRERLETTETVKREWNHSLAPFGLTTDIAARRLKRFSDTPEDDSEVVMAELWEEANIVSLSINKATAPIDHILHKCAGSCSEDGNTHYFSEDLEVEKVRVASATVQWLATNCGRAFLEEFFEVIGYKIVPTNRPQQE